MRLKNKFKVITVGLLCLSLKANAESARKMGGEMRVDYVVENSNDSTQTSGVAVNSNNELKSRHFNLPWAGIWFGDQIDSKTSYYFHFVAAAGQNAGSDVTAVSAKEAYMTHMFHENFSLTAGKIYVDANSFEGQNYAHAIYDTTMVNADTPFDYKAGVMGKFAWDNHEVGLYLTDGYKADGTKVKVASTYPGREANQKTPLMGITWKGKFWEDRLTFHASYFNGKHENQANSPSGAAAATSKNDNFWRAAVQAGLTEDKALQLELMYGANTYNKATNNSGKTTVNSIHGMLSYMYESWKPMFKYESSRKKINNTAYLNRNAFLLGVEYFPMGNTDWNIHLVYWNHNDKYKAAATTEAGGTATNGTNVKTSQWLLGMTYML